MNFDIGGGYNLPLINFWNEENKKLERAFKFAADERKQNE